MATRDTIEVIKREIDLVSLIRAKGIVLRNKGMRYTGRCPFHDDNTSSLSVNPEDKLWQCDSCAQGGDAIRFVELFDQVDFGEAVERLKDKGVKRRKARHPKVTTTPLNIAECRLLARVVAYYQHSLGQDHRGGDYLKNKRGVAHHQSLIDFGVGYANGTLEDILPEDEAVMASLKKIGILNDRGKERFYRCVTIPLYDKDGAVVDLYGCHIEAGGATHLYLPGLRRGLVNRRASKRTETLVLTESVLDALTLYDRGYTNNVPVYGKSGFTDEHLSLFNRRLNAALIVFHADAAGIKAARAIAARLREKQIDVRIVRLPVRDLSLYFKDHLPESFASLLEAAAGSDDPVPDNVVDESRRAYTLTNHGFKVSFGARQYEVKGIQRSDTQLKATIKASTDLDGNRPFELSTIDLYSSRSRVWFARMCAELFEAVEEVVKEDIARLLNLVEDYRPQKKQTGVRAPTGEERAAALRLLKNPEMFAEILADLSTIGVAGEETNKLVGYLTAVSRKTDEPLSVLIQSRSAAGKSTLQDAILALVPKEDYVKYTRITDQALFYKDEDSLVHKVLAIEEVVGMGGAAYSIRNIQSARKITVAATGKDPGSGKMRTEEHTVKGPVAVMITTTAAELEGETASRFLFLTIDESAEMTEAIHRLQREAETLEGLLRKKKSEHIIKKHHAAQRLLKPLAVVNPFAACLTYPNRSLRTRRDHKKYLGLIRTVAYLHQYQREIKTVQVEGKPVEYIEVELADIAAANKLANQVLGQCLDELAPPSRTLLVGIFAMIKEMAVAQDCGIEAVYFSRRQIREHLGWTDWQIRAHIKQLEELEYLHVRAGARGKQYAYALIYKGQREADGRFYLDLAPIEEIEREMQTGAG